MMSRYYKFVVNIGFQSNTRMQQGGAMGLPRDAPWFPSTESHIEGVHYECLKKGTMYLSLKEIGR